MGRRVAILAGGPALLALLFVYIAGCGGCSRDPESYPVEFTFRPREDPLVLQLPTETPAEIPASDKHDEALRQINRRGGKVREPSAVPTPIRDELYQVIGQTFGTPAAPMVGGDDESRALAAGLGLTDANLAAGSRLFRRLCVSCHGTLGDGRGETADWVTPRPRDYRLGAFKFTSTANHKPSRADLFRTLSTGFQPKAAMPGFAMRSEDDRQRLIDYVMYLSLRGRTEFDVLKAVLLHGEDGLDGTAADHATAVLKNELKAWTSAQSSEIPANPPDLADDSPELAESVRRGHALFHDPKGAGCATCHVKHGREAKPQYDVWGTLIRPADLTEPKRKAGDDPATLFQRIRGGIAASGMPAAVGLTDAQTWDVVHFLRALPYPDRLSPDVKAKVYGE
jgi:mono/diheme cytochrome c family protein